MYNYVSVHIKRATSIGILTRMKYMLDKSFGQLLLKIMVLVWFFHFYSNIILKLICASSSCLTACISESSDLYEFSRQCHIEEIICILNLHLKTASCSDQLFTFH